MKMQNSILDLASTQLTTSNRSKKTDLPVDTGTTKFDSYLKDSMNRKNANKVENDEPEKNATSYRQVVSHKPIKMKSVEKSSDTVEQDPLEEVDNDETVKVKEDAVMKGLAEILGISTNDLKQMLADFGIKASDLADSTTYTQAVAKLSMVLGLDHQQQADLNQVLGEINAAVDAVIEKNASGADKSGWVKVEGVNVEVVNSTKPDLVKIAKDLEDRVHSIVERLQSGETLSVGDISERIKQLMSQVSLQKRIAEAEKNKDLDVKKEAKATEQDEQTVPVESEGVQTVFSFQQAENIGDQNHNFTAGKDDVTVINAIGSSEFQKTSDIAKALRTNGEVRVVRNELMTQVIEKAKVMLDGQKSEMIMELRPESLGKLALKVVTENGIVMAKFVAENQQVKEVLESNMQLLKDTLEQQGLTIQGFSVSVGQDSQGGHNLQQYSGGKNSPSSDDMEIGQMMPGMLDEEGITRTNPYEVGNSSVDYRA